MNSNNNTVPSAIKAVFGDDIRRFPFGMVPNYKMLMNKICNAFDDLEANLVILRYKDDELDLVTISCQVEYLEAQQFAQNGILRIFVKSMNENTVSAPESLTPVLAVPAPTQSAPAPSAPVYESTFIGYPSVDVVESSAPDCCSPQQNEEDTNQEEELDMENVPFHIKKMLANPDLPEWKRQKLLFKARKHQLKAQKPNKICQRESFQQWKQEKAAFKDEKRAMKKEWKQQRGCCRRGMWGQQNQNQNQQPKAARFVKHISFADGACLEPDTPFLKIWRIRNDSVNNWPEGLVLIPVGKEGDRMSCPDSVSIASCVRAGDEVDVSVPLVAPSRPGTYTGFWKVAICEGIKFGQRLRCQIEVVNTSSEESSSSEEEKEKTLPAETVALLQDQLTSMGFTDQGLNAKLIRKFDGELVPIINKLLRKQRNQIAKDQKRQ